MIPRFAILLSLFHASNGFGIDHTDKRIIVIAHRGAHDQAPENSLAAIRKAAELGCDYVEIDVRTTVDHQLVLMHDSTVDRTTKGKGRVAEMTLEEIRALSFETEWPDERVPTVDEALSVCKGRIKVYIDHKDASPDKVLAAVERSEMLADIVVYGSVETLRMYKSLAPKVWIMPPHPDTAEEIAKLVTDLKPETLDGNIVEWNVEHVKSAHAAGAQVWVDYPAVYDSEFGILKAIELDIDAIQTDHPQRLIELLKSHNLR
ncbi:MAG: glycerophosphodiester phosphodiesterase family protein [Planctomycetaceae bacterium]